MYKVLLVDDEKIERESISRLIEWEKNGIDFLGAAKNGIEAYDIIIHNPPDIVITDIKMPIMNGLELIEKVKKDFPKIIFVVISGYGEYEYTSKAMQYGVRHYLLKPCEEEKILEVLSSVKQDLSNKEEEYIFVNKLQGSLENVMPHAKEQCLREFALSGAYNKDSCDYFKSLFGIVENSFKLVVLKIENECEFIDLFALKNISEEVIQIERVYISTVIEDSVVLLIKGLDDNELFNMLTNIRNIYLKYYKISFWMAVSERDAFDNIHNMYRQVKILLKYRFNLRDGSIITKAIIDEDRSKKAVDLSSDFDSISNCVKHGRIEELNLGLNIFFAKIETKNPMINEIKDYCIKLLEIILLQAAKEVQDKYENIFEQMKEYHHVKDFHDTIKKVFTEITYINKDINANNYDSLVDSIIKCIHENISNPDLKLSWIAKEKLFMNDEYLGRIFYKKNNVKFSQYVLKIRMEMAKKLIENTGDLKIYNISRLIGFAEDAQYFSKVFKKYTGLAPSEYKKALEK